MGQDQYNGEEKRQHSRIVFKPKNRPRLDIQGNAFVVDDISQGGIKFINDRHVKLAEQFTGTITFYDGESIHIEGRIAWREGDAVGVQFNELIPESIVMKDNQYVNIDWES